jgi:hypothetical protein
MLYINFVEGFKMKSYIAMILSFLFLLLLFSCAPRPLSENRIAQIVPEEILTYSSSGETHIMLVKKVTIDRRQTNEKMDTVYAIVDMDDSIVHKTGYYIFTINYYDKGGWIIDEWEQYQAPILYLIEPPSDEMVSGVIAEQFKNYTLISKDTSNPGDGCFYKFRINDDGVNLKITGEISIVFHFSEKNISWVPSVHSNELVPVWENIVGSWRGEFRYRTSNQVLNLNISGIADTTISAILDVRPFSGRIYSSDDGYSLNDFSNHLVFEIFSGSTWTGRWTSWTFHFTSDDAFAVYTGDWNSGDVQLRKR